MPVVRRCPHCSLAVVDTDGRCTHCGQPLGGDSRVVTFDHAARAQRARVAFGSGEASDTPVPEPPSVPWPASPAAPRDSQANAPYDPRVLLTLLIPLVPLIVCVTLGRNGGATTGDVTSQVLARAGIVWTQYLILRMLSGERMFVAVLVLQLVASVSPGQPGAEDRGLFEANLVLLLAGLQALGLASFRLWRGPKTEAGTPCPHRPDKPAQEQIRRPGGLEPMDGFHQIEGEHHADFAV
jgi:hypothetical protein